MLLSGYLYENDGRTGITCAALSDMAAVRILRQQIHGNLLHPLRHEKSRPKFRS